METNTGMERFRRGLASLATLVVAAASFALSYVALSDVSVRVGAVPPGLGWLVPIVVDGGVICGSAIIWSHSKLSTRRPVFPFLFVGALVTISVIINAAHAGPSLLAKGIASLPPLVLLGTLELVASQGRRDRSKRDTPEETISSSRMTMPHDVATHRASPVPQPAPNAARVASTVTPVAAGIRVDEDHTDPFLQELALAAESGTVGRVTARAPGQDWDGDTRRAIALSGRDRLETEMDTITTRRSAPPSRRSLRVRAEEPTV